MKKRSLKKYPEGGITQLMTEDGNVTPSGQIAPSLAIGLAGAIGNKGGEEKGESIGTGIGTAAGSALNMVVPGLGLIAAPILGKLGGMAGKAIGDNLDDNPEKAAAKAENDAMLLSQYQKSQQGWSNKTQTSNGLTFANGGVIPEPTAELELNEQFQLPNGQVGEVDGASHSEGGVPVTLPEGTRVFSDRLKHNGKTFAKITKPINSKIEKIENNNTISSTLKDNTLMLLNKQLDHVFDVQESLKQEQNMKRSLKMAKGGLVKYPNGGPVLGSINPETGQPYTKQEIMNFNSNPFTVKPRPVNMETINPVQARTIGATPTLSVPELTTTSAPSNPKFQSTSESTEKGDNIGQIGQVATALATTALQNRNLNKLARPKTLAKLKLADKVANPELVDYSAERNQIDQSYLASADSAQRNLSNSATAQAFKNQANLARLQGTGKSWQNQSNVNTEIKNRTLGQRTQAAIQEEMANNDIDKYNLENQYNYDTFKTGQKNAIIGQFGNTAGQVFGNQTKYQNQLDQAEILSNQYDPSVYRDTTKKRTFKKGGTIRKK